MAKKILITTGDPAGCGPFISLAAVDTLKKGRADFFVVGDRQVLERISVYRRIKKRINLINCNTCGIEHLKKGEQSELAGRAAINYLNTALLTMKSENIKHLVTAPLSKESVSMSLPGFCGHTEYLAEYFAVKNFAMMMYSQKLKAVLFTRHVSLRDVGELIKEEQLAVTFSLVYGLLQKTFGIKKPSVAVVSFNPHAGINTFLEQEEKEIVGAINRCGHKIYGPFPSDTLFIPENIRKYDCVICLYHDQAMIPFKLLAIKSGVNITLGLPIIRTSPAHGAAYDVIKQNRIPFSSSMIEAVKLALKLDA